MVVNDREIWVGIGIKIGAGNKSGLEKKLAAFEIAAEVGSSENNFLRNQQESVK